MRATPAGEHLVQLTALKLVNAYLVREADGFTLVDTTVLGQAGSLMAAARDAGGPIRRVLVTHAHADHVGSLDALAKEIPGLEVHAGAREVELLRGDRAPHPHEPKGRIFAPAYQSVKAEIRPLREGDRVGSLEAVAAPGHTPGQTAYRDTRDGTLLCGDAFLAVNGVFVTNELKPWFPFPALVGTWHKPTAFATAEKLRALEPTRLGTGHGPVVEDPLAAMDAAIAKSPRG